MSRLKLLTGLLFPDGTTQDTAATGGASTPASTAPLAFTGETLKRFTIVDATVDPTKHIVGNIRRVDIAEVADFGWVYNWNIVTVTTGSFDILVSVLDEDSPARGPGPTETVTFIYNVWS